MPKYLVLHDMVGKHFKGSIVSLAELGPGAEIDRLLRLGALAEFPSGSISDLSIDPATMADPEMGAWVLTATEFLERELDRSSIPVSISWTLAEDQKGRRVVRLGISDSTSQIQADFTREDFQDSRQVSARLIRVWGDFLQERSHNQIASLARQPVHVDGGDVLDLISDAISEYTEPAGTTPRILKIPVRQAIALVKLGHAFWGDLFQQIREHGIQAIEGKPLFGVPVKLVYGVDARLELE